ncbi:TetR/AcrR family transcriptional regulator [Pseudomonas chlororaphis]|uniref:TetR/AcrR family transcriptional regulator n=1 Tax=Pseudomonas chlororaphis TaxID=587753 RepID=UPI0018B00442|nr:TetR/AcrR family transcriptional regulator [Pseudomonas chlororaphis]
MRTKSPEIRRRLVKIATEKFLELGYRDTSMALISSINGGSKTTLYTHFPTKEELFLEVVGNLAKGRVETAFKALRPNADLRQVLLDFGERYLSVTCSKDLLKVFRMGISESESSSAGKLVYEYGPRMCRKRISCFFDDQVARQVIRDCDTHIAAVHYLRLIESDLAELFLLGIRNEPSSEEIRRSVETGVTVFLSAYCIAA